MINPGMPGFSPGGLALSSTVPTLSVFPNSFTFPMPESQFYPVYLSNTKPILRAPYTQNWTFGIQRQLAKGTVMRSGTQATAPCTCGTLTTCRKPTFLRMGS